MTPPPIDLRTFWLIILAAGIGTFALRLSFIQLFEQFDQFPPRLERGFRFVPAAVFAALVLPTLLLVGGDLSLSPTNSKLLAAVVAGGVGWWSQSIIATLLVGMGTLWLLEFVIYGAI